MYAALRHSAPTRARAALTRLAAARLLACVALSVACVKDPLDGLTIVGDDPSDLPLKGLDETWQARFDEGDALFEQPYRPAQGLGPLYVRQACASCHADDARGPGGVTTFVLVEDDGITPATDQSALRFGHVTRTQRTAGATQGIEPPTDPTVRTALRLGPPVFARGFLEAVPDATIEALETAQATRDDGIHGRIHRVCRKSEANADQPFHAHEKGDCGLIGRFGVKARLATIDDFTADAFQGDMGLTSPLRPEELPNPDGLADDLLEGTDVDLDTVNLVADYVRLLRVPKRETPDTKGPALFAAARCDACHVPVLRTDETWAVPQLAGVDAAVFTDLLLHDMGDGLADSLPEGAAGPRDWRTAPLVGMRFLRRFLHDGRAATLTAAIEAHASDGSEANDSVARWRALPEADRAALDTYLRTL